MWFQKGPKKAARLEKKGDRFASQEKFEKALNYYQKSERLNSDRSEIYQKLHETFQKIEKEWNQEDFELSMYWTMRQQELENPEVKLVYEKFSPEYQEIQKLIKRLMATPEENEEEKIITKIMDSGPSGIMALIDFVLSIKKIAQGDPPSPETQEPPESSEITP